MCSSEPGAGVCWEGLCCSPVKLGTVEGRVVLFSWWDRFLCSPIKLGTVEGRAVLFSWWDRFLCSLLPIKAGGWGWWQVGALCSQEQLLMLF